MKDLMTGKFLLEEQAVEQIIAPPDFDGPTEGTIAIIVRGSFWKYGLMRGVSFFTDPVETLQVAAIRHPQGHVIPVHRHVPYRRSVEGTQEVILVRWGSLTVTFHLSCGTLLTERRLNAGDMVILMRGGHGMTVTEDCELLEVKQGPYDQERDKVRM